MTPSVDKLTSPTQVGSMKASTEISIKSNVQSKENQRPPVYNAEDYISFLKKFAHRPKNEICREVPTTTDIQTKDKRPTSLLLRDSDYKSPIPTPEDLKNEMALKQFGSISDLLSKLRADLKVSFPSFVQELVSWPLDGISVLLEVLRVIQLSQNTNPSNSILSQQNTMQRNVQTTQRRALLDELACLQCLNLCCTRNTEASIRLGTTSIGLLPLAAAATGQGIRSRIIALQLLTIACDRNSIPCRLQTNIQNGHTSVSEALSTLRLRCGEPVRFRLLVGMLNSSGGTGELQAYGLKFINTFLSSAENAQNKLYIQAELTQAGFDPTNMTKMVTSSTQWSDKIRSEVNLYEDTKVDINKLLLQARESDRIRSQMVILERRVQILQEEKAILKSIERRLQERCAELQREIFRFQESKHSGGSMDKRPVALPRQMQPQNNPNSSEAEDEGISSSETGQSISPEPILHLSDNNPSSKEFLLNLSHNLREDDSTIDDVIEELKNIVDDAEREILLSKHKDCRMEKNIVPVNILPQPPRKSKSLSHLFASESDLEGSDYGLISINNESKSTFLLESDYENNLKSLKSDCNDDADVELMTKDKPNNTNREILNVIMDARETTNFTTKATGAGTATVGVDFRLSDPMQQKFNGVFFMADMNTPRKFSSLCETFEAKRINKRMDPNESSYGNGIDSMIDIVMGASTANNKTNPIGRHSCCTTNPSKGQIQKTRSFKFFENQLNNVTELCANSSKLSDLPSGLY